jgi:hypothetical protein
MLFIGVDDAARDLAAAGARTAALAVPDANIARVASDGTNDPVLLRRIS